MEQVDIIIPVFNGKKYINACLKSIQNQTYPYWRVICVDDGSIDGSGEALDELARKDSRITVVHHQENKGIIESRISGMKRISAPWTIFVDIDDTLEPDMLQTLMNRAKVEGEIICCAHNTLSKHGLIKRKHVTMGGTNQYPGSLAAMYVSSGTTINASLWGKVYPLGIIQKCIHEIEKLPRIFWGEDTIINSVLFKAAEKVTVIDNPLYNYRYGGASAKNSNVRMIELAALYDWRKAFLNDMGAEEKFFKNNLCHILNAAIYYAHYTDIPVNREKCCKALANAIGDIERYCPNYDKKFAFSGPNMTDTEFAGIYKEQLTVRMKQLILSLL